MRFMLDTNILIYTRDFRDPRKQGLASRWVTSLAAREAAVVNRQVLNEVCHVALRRLAHLGPLDVRRWVEDLAELGDAPTDGDTVKAAWPIHLRYRLSWFDCLILSAAERLGCSHVLTEDMGAPRRIGFLDLVNPFGADPDDILTKS